MTRANSLSGLTCVLLAGLLCAGCSKSDGTQSAAAANAAAGTTPPAPTPANISASIALQGTPPATATVGESYTYQPVVNSNSDNLTFTSTGLPAWLTLNSNSGVLAGTPSVTDEGTTGHITITVAAGNASASSTPFTIRVVAPAAGDTGSVKLSWVPPTQNTDGTPVSELAGYRIYYGTDPSELTESINIVGATATSYVVDGLAAGTYYFSVSAYTSGGLNSGLSNIADQAI